MRCHVGIGLTHKYSTEMSTYANALTFFKVVYAVRNHVIHESIDRTKLGVLAYLGVYVALSLCPILVLVTYFLYQYSSGFQTLTNCASQFMSIFLVFQIITPTTDVLRGYR